MHKSSIPLKQMFFNVLLTLRPANVYCDVTRNRKMTSALCRKANYMKNHNGTG